MSKTESTIDALCRTLDSTPVTTHARINRAIALLEAQQRAIEAQAATIARLETELARAQNMPAWVVE